MESDDSASSPSEFGEAAINLAVATVGYGAIWLGERVQSDVVVAGGELMMYGGGAVAGILAIMGGVTAIKESRRRREIAELEAKFNDVEPAPRVGFFRRIISRLI